MPGQKVKMKKVASSNIDAIGYDEVSKTLHVTFKGAKGSKYVYSGVPKRTHADLMAADSHGSFLNARIKGTYPFRKTAI